MNDAPAEAASSLRGHLLRSMLDGSAGPPRRVIVRCESLGWDVARPMIVVVAQLDASEETDRSSGRRSAELWAAAWEQIVRSHDRAAPVVGFAHEIVTLLPSRVLSRGLDVADVVRAVSGRRPGAGRSFGTGISRRIETVAELPVAYEQAVTAVAVGRRIHGPDAIVDFDSLGSYRLLSLANEDELRSFAVDVLGSLAYDDQESARLRATLRTLLDTNCNVARAARTLHFHYNSLRYRISVLERIVGPFMTDAELRLKLGLALRIVAMSGP